MIEAGLDNEPFHSRLPLKGPGHFPAAILGPHDTVLKKGDMLQYDGGPCHKGYWSDIQRNACVGEPPALERTLYDAAMEAQEAAIQVIKPGIRAKDIHNAATEALVRLVPSFDINRCVFVGHGIGLHTHELPYLVPSGREADFVIREGMYLAVEVSAFDAPQFRVIGGFPEDNILVTENGCDNLTKGIPKQLWIG
jgi:Xaa-Pro dipeptidase